MTMIVNNWETIAWLVAAIAAFFGWYSRFSWLNYETIRLMKGGDCSFVT